MSSVRAAVDVAIVGAGAAGSAAACVLAPTLSVALIDRVAMPGWRIGESLPGAARRLLTAIGGWERFAEAKHGVAPLKVSRWGSDEPVELDSMRDPDGPGWRLDRARFEADLRASSVDCGAMLTIGGVARLARVDGGWRLTFDDGETLAARRVIDASGRRSALLRTYGQRRLAADRSACVHQRIVQAGSADPTTYTEASRDGWWYTARLPAGDRLVAFHADAGSAALREVFAVGPLAVARGMAGLAAAIGPDDGMVGPAMLCAAGSVARTAAGDGWLAAGDAAIALDPLSSQGLFNALATGLEAAQATLAVLAGDGDAIARYAGRIGRIWNAYLGHHTTYYGMERRWPDAPFWSRRSPARRSS